MAQAAQAEDNGIIGIGEIKSEVNAYGPTRAEVNGKSESGK